MSADAVRPTLLLVDDEPRILSALRRSLRREGFDLVLAGSAVEALEVLAERRVDFVVSDQKMPDKSGLELLEEVAERWPGVGRALLTGWPEEVSKARAEAAGLAAVLAKPWDDVELKALLHGRMGQALPGEARGDAARLADVRLPRG